MLCFESDLNVHLCYAASTLVTTIFCTVDMYCVMLHLQCTALLCFTVSINALHVPCCT